MEISSKKIQKPRTVYDEVVQIAITVDQEFLDMVNFIGMTSESERERISNSTRAVAAGKFYDKIQKHLLAEKIPRDDDLNFVMPQSK